MRREFLSPALFHYYKKPLMVVEGRGQYLYDETGRRYLDGFGGIVTVSVGHCHPHVVAAAPAINLVANGGTIGGTVFVSGDHHVTGNQAVSGTATITGQTLNNSPVANNDYFIYYNAASNSIEKCTIAACTSASPIWWYMWL
jgi:hypothetical protein